MPHMISDISMFVLIPNISIPVGTKVNRIGNADRRGQDQDSMLERDQECRDEEEVGLGVQRHGRSWFRNAETGRKLA